MDGLLHAADSQGGIHNNDWKSFFFLSLSLSRRGDVLNKKGMRDLFHTGGDASTLCCTEVVFRHINLPEFVWCVVKMEPSKGGFRCGEYSTIGYGDKRWLLRWREKWYRGGLFRTPTRVINDRHFGGDAVTLRLICLTGSPTGRFTCPIPRRETQLQTPRCSPTYLCTNRQQDL